MLEKEEEGEEEEEEEKEEEEEEEVEEEEEGRERRRRGRGRESVDGWVLDHQVVFWRRDGKPSWRRYQRRPLLPLECQEKS